MPDTATLLRIEEKNKEFAERIETFALAIAHEVRTLALDLSDMSVNGVSAFCGNWQDLGTLPDKASDIVLALMLQDPRFVFPRQIENYTDAWPSAGMQLLATQVRVTP